MKEKATAKCGKKSFHLFVSEHITHIKNCVKDVAYCISLCLKSRIASRNKKSCLKAPRL